MTCRHILLASSTLLAAAISTSAFAQSAASTNVIEELVVTAEKRDQSLQDVPVAITAFTDQRREIVGINSIQDMTNFTPGLQYNSSTDRVSLRGVGRLTNVLSAEASVANYNDGVFETFAVHAGHGVLHELDVLRLEREAAGVAFPHDGVEGGAFVLDVEIHVAGLGEDHPAQLSPYADKGVVFLDRLLERIGQLGDRHLRRV